MAAAMLLPAAPHAYAITSEQQKWCDGKDDASPDLRISSCSAVIEQTKVKKQKGDAYTNRGKAYRAKGDSEHAIRDFDEAIKIDSKDGEAFYNRSLTFMRPRRVRPRAAGILDRRPSHSTRSIRGGRLKTLSHIYYDKREYQRSIDVLNLAIKLNQK